jgi:hypothetical protein
VVRILSARPESIQRNKVICLECGKEFKQLTGRHLALHGLEPKAYKEKYEIPLRQALSARTLSARRRKVVKEEGPRERLKKAGGGSKLREAGPVEAGGRRARLLLLMGERESVNGGFTKLNNDQGGRLCLE